METSGTVLVAGATGGVGRRVVNVLRKKGIPVRVLVLRFHLVLAYLLHDILTYDHLISFTLLNDLYCLIFLLSG